MIRALAIAVCDLLIVGAVCLILWILGGATDPIHSQPPAPWPGVTPTLEVTAP